MNKIYFPILAILLTFASAPAFACDDDDLDDCFRNPSEQARDAHGDYVEQEAVAQKEATENGICPKNEQGHLVGKECIAEVKKIIERNSAEHEASSPNKQKLCYENDMDDVPADCVKSIIPTNKSDAGGWKDIDPNQEPYRTFNQDKEKAAKHPRTADDEREDNSLPARAHRHR